MLTENPGEELLCGGLVHVEGNLIGHQGLGLGAFRQLLCTAGTRSYQNIRENIYIEKESQISGSGSVKAQTDLI